MFQLLRENAQFYLFLFIWWLSGVYLGSQVGILVVILSIFLFQKRGLYDEILIGFVFILILSDRLEFAKDVKNLYMVLLAIIFFFSGDNFLFRNTFYKKFIAFFLVASFCMIFSEQMSTSIQKTISYILLIIIVPNYIEKLYNDDNKAFFKKIILFIFLYFLLSLLVSFINKPLVYTFGRYKALFLANPNGLGVFCFVSFLLVTIIFDYNKSLFSKKEKIALYLLIIISLIFSESRNSITSISIFLLFRYFYRITPFLGFIVFLVIIFVNEYIFQNVNEVIIAFGLEDYFRLDTLDTGSGRLVAWEFAWKKVQENIFIGKGFSNTEYIFEKYQLYLNNLGHQGNAHNSYLTLWLDTGLIGLVCYLLALFSIFLGAAKKTFNSIPIMYAVLFSIFFESWITASLNPFTIMLLITLTIIGSDNIVPAKEPELPTISIKEELR